jgi:hypothetical protein
MCANMRQSAGTAQVFLSSWKEIAAYLGRGVRTVQRWERELRLPVHRIGKGKRSPVYSTTTELKFWVSTVEVARDHRLEVPFHPGTRSREPLEDSRRLLTSVRDLAQAIAETSIRQRQQTEILQARVLRMRSRMK